ncbi:hypothetical protein MSAN_00057600 [Mycena sanguinolenta]|uniref:DUF221-domain-containing protein n=1 Tax=Mycena sanguinolenta TaxID=230812 RepID=A0A8H7DMA8_9AGAR|nr:hypothetical protein MSAN_00057600 [Mycena sanguinolenta]
MSLTAAQVNNSNNTKTFVTALVANGGLLVVEVAAFVVLKNRLGRIYSPRTFLPPPAKRAHELPVSWWRWLPALLVESPRDVINNNGLDAYMTLRYLKMLIWIFLVFTISTFLVIVPVDIVGIPSSSSTDPLQRLTWTNIPGTKEDEKRLSAHLIMMYLLTFFVLFMIRREMLHFVDVRHKFLISKSHSRLAQARTVLIVNVPEELANEHDLRLFASFVPGGIDRVWMYRDTKKLNKLFQRRQDACKKLEAAESDVLKHATKAWRNKELEHRKMQKKKKQDEEQGDTPLELPEVPPRELLDELVPEDDRPKHRTGFLGLFGKKVETIPWCTDEIAKLNREIAETRQHTGKGKFLGSVFIRCNLQLGAHVLAQCVSYHQPLAMKDKWMETSPKDIVWENLDDGALEMTGRYVTSWIATIGLIIAWGFPVAFIGTLSQINTLCQQVHWLNWVCTAPNPVPGIIQGILPPVLLAILFALLPLVLRLLAWYECIPRYSLMSISVYRRFFLFLLIHGFLIVTLSSTFTTLVHQIINNPTSTVQNLAAQLPSASLFFLTYMVTQGLAGAGAALAQLFPIVIHFVRKWFLGRTPRQAYSVTFLMPSTDFGLLLPRLSLLAVIGFVYSVLNPSKLIKHLLGYSMFYLAFKFLLTQVYDQPDESETGGMYFPISMSNLFVGLYIAQVCLACLFFLKASVSPSSAVAEGVLMLVLIAITAMAQMMITRSFQPITDFLPMSLATKKMAKRYEKHQQKHGGPVTPNEELNLDIFRQHSTLRSVRRRVTRLPRQLDRTLFSLKEKVKEEGERLAAPRSAKSAKQKMLEEQQREAEAQAKQEAAEQEAAAMFEEADEEEEVERDPQQKAAEEAVMDDLKNGDAPELYHKPSTSAKASKKSKKASKQSGSRQSKVDPAAPVDLSDEDVSSDEEEEQDDHAFDHPSTYVEQPWIWIPKDRLGLSKLLVDDLHASGVDASDLGAVMDKKGIVEVTRNPPDEEWYGGNDL